MTTRKRALGLALAVLSVAAAAAACGDDDDEGGGTADGSGNTEVDDARGDEVRTTLATMLYENPGSRDHFLEQAEQDDPDLWADIDADGEVTLEEFRSIPDVQDAVNAYSGDILGALQS